MVGWPKVGCAGFPKAGPVDPGAEGAPNVDLGVCPNGEAPGCEGCPKAGVVEPNAGFPKAVAGVVDPNPAAPNLGPEGVEGAPKEVAAGLLNELFPPPGVGILEGDAIFGAAGVAGSEVALFGVMRPG